MPWRITRNDSGCPASRPWGVRKESDGELEGCHETREDAARQIAALEIAERENRVEEALKRVRGVE